MWLLAVVPASAVELTGTQIKELISGNSVHLQTTAASVTGAPGQGVIYYDADGNARYKTPTGAVWHGTWAIKDNSACLSWKETARNDCVKYSRQGEIIAILNAVTGETRAKVLKITTGNTEKIIP